MREVTSIHERISSLVEVLANGNISLFAKKLDVSEGNIRGYIKGVMPKHNFLESIVRNYEVSPAWLLTGKGEMLLSNGDHTPPINLTPHTPQWGEKLHDMQLIPLYDITASAGFHELFEGGKSNILHNISIPNLSRVDGAISITGDSMYPLLKSGDIVIFKHINDIQHIHYGDIYILSYHYNDDEYIVTKYINKSDQEGCIRLVSYNQHYAPIDIPMSCIRALAIVKASIRYNTMG